MRLIEYMSEGWRIPQNWRLQSARYGTASGGLQGNVCPEGHPLFPPREICPECAQELSIYTPVELSSAVEKFLAFVINSPPDNP